MTTMIDTYARGLTVTAAIGAGLAAGVYLPFSTFVMPGLPNRLHLVALLLGLDGLEPRPDAGRGRRRGQPRPRPARQLIRASAPGPRRDGPPTRSRRRPRRSRRWSSARGAD